MSVVWDLTLTGTPPNDLSLISATIGFGQTSLLIFDCERRTRITDRKSRMLEASLR
jgi:hypothetical protein